MSRKLIGEQMEDYPEITDAVDSILERLQDLKEAAAALQVELYKLRDKIEKCQFILAPNEPEPESESEAPSLIERLRPIVDPNRQTRVTFFDVTV
jgi:hypothetical protein